MRRPRVLVLKVAALQVGRREVLQVVQPVELQVVQLVGALQVALLAVQPEPVRQAQLELRVLLEQRVPRPTRCCNPWCLTPCAVSNRGRAASMARPSTMPIGSGWRSMAWAATTPQARSLKAACGPCACCRCG